MSCNIILITNGSRPRLLDQTLRTLENNTPAGEYNVTLVCDGTPESVYRGEMVAPSVVGSLLVIEPPRCIIGQLKNIGAYWSEKVYGRGEWLCFVDDDVAFFPEWLGKTQMVMESSNVLRLLGGVRHPYHGINSGHGTMEGRFGWQSTDAVAGYCHFMRWSTWDKFGPYDAHAKGTGQSEDFAICRKIVDAGGKVGYIHPPVMAHCGITDSGGHKVLGADLIEQVEGVLYL